MTSGQDKRKWVLIGPLPPPVTGQSIAFRSLADSLQGECANVVDLSFRGTGTQRRARHLLHFGRLLWRSAFALLVARRNVYLTIAQSKAGFMRDAPIILFAFLLRRRIVCHLHGGNYDAFYAGQSAVFKRFIRYTLRCSDVLIVLSARLRPMFAFDAKLLAKIVVVENGLPCTDEVCGSPRDLLQTQHSPLRILFLSNLIPSKGYLVLAEALHVLVRHHALAVTCKFCGTFYSVDGGGRIVQDPIAERDFVNWLSAQGLDRGVQFCGEVECKEKIDLLKEADIFVLPTTYVNEGQPIAIIEAMAFGAVVITTDHRAISDLVIDKQTGLLIPPNDPEALVAAILFLANNPGELTRISAGAFALYRERFTRVRHIEAMHKVLNV